MLRFLWSIEMAVSCTSSKQIQSESVSYVWEAISLFGNQSGLFCPQSGKSWKVCSVQNIQWLVSCCARPPCSFIADINIYYWVIEWLYKSKDLWRMSVIRPTHVSDITAASFLVKSRCLGSQPRFHLEVKVWSLLCWVHYIELVSIPDPRMKTWRKRWF
jgi:hypothetical protein